MNIKLIDYAKEFLLKYFSDYKEKTSNNIEDDIIGGDTEFIERGYLRWNKTPFFFALEKLIKENKIKYYIDKNSNKIYFLNKRVIDMIEYWENVHKEDNKRWLAGSTLKEVLENLELKDYDFKNKIVLEIGVGLGICTKELSYMCLIDVYDISETAIKRVKDYIRKGFIENVNDLPKNQYDLVISHLVSQHMNNDDLERQLKQVIPSLKKNGLFAMQFAYPIENINDNNESIENCQLGEVKRTLNYMKELIKNNEGIVEESFNKGEYSQFKQGWYSLYIRKLINK